LSVAASAKRRLGRSLGSPGPGWLAPEALVHRRLGTAETTAQVDPAAFTRGLMDAALARGAELRSGTVDGLARSAERVTGAMVSGAVVKGDAVVIAMGPWSGLAAGWLQLPRIYGLKGHSVVFRNPDGITPHALFVECEAADGSVGTPEVFPRPDGTTYICGLSSEEPLPPDPAAVATDGHATARLRAMTRTFAPALAEAEVVSAQACYRPVTRDGLPLIGPVRDLEGAYVATGHSVWGMLNAPATGEALAELIVEGACRTVDLAPFDPARLPPLSAR
jgi:glycine/D-amino acid oxidase-like deaminating enzyme